jgi:hypothetical protein
VTATRTTDTGVRLSAVANPAPGPAARVGRTAGQGGGVVIFINLWQAFGWMGADTWTAEQAAQRWPAITAAAIGLVSIAQNAWNWWRSERIRTTESITVTAEQTPPGEAAA